MTLQEDDLPDTTNETTEPTTPAPAAKQDRTRAVIDATAGTVTVQDTAGTTIATHSIQGVPDQVRAHLALVGLHRTLQSAADPEATLAKLRAGEIPGRGPGKPKELAPWLLAYAHAKVEATKKSDNPLTLDAAKALAEGLDKDARRLIKTNPLVVKHYAKLTGSGADLV